MLEFAHKPPRNPEDIIFSDTDRMILERAKIGPYWDRIDGLGQAACSELIDTFGDDAPETLDDLHPFNRHVLDQAVEILGTNLIHAFANGTTTMQLLHLQAQEVAA